MKPCGCFKRYACFAASPEGGNWKKLDCGRKFCGRATDGAAPLGLRSQKFWLYHLFVFPATFQAKVQRFREDQNHWKHLYGGCRSATWQRGRKDGTKFKILEANFPWIRNPELPLFFFSDSSWASLLWDFGWFCYSTNDVIGKHQPRQLPTFPTSGRTQSSMEIEFGNNNFNNKNFLFEIL